MKINDRIFDLIKEKGITQKEFSARTGIPQSTISDWKGKDLNPSAGKILKICEVLDVTPYELLGAGDPDEKDEYIMVGRGTDEFEIICNYTKLRRRSKERLQGYLQALLDNEK